MQPETKNHKTFWVTYYSRSFPNTIFICTFRISSDSTIVTRFTVLFFCLLSHFPVGVFSTSSKSYNSGSIYRSQFFFTFSRLVNIFHNVFLLIFSMRKPYGVAFSIGFYNFKRKAVLYSFN